uniref:(northern house mosquito) hypothetical protein n=1 Tax=Culex pipiens TaxID=7175 RepID=A0A8D8AUQ2_CULPI
MLDSDVRRPLLHLALGTSTVQALHVANLQHQCDDSPNSLHSDIALQWSPPKWFSSTKFCPRHPNRTSLPSDLALCRNPLDTTAAGRRYRPVCRTGWQSAAWCHLPQVRRWRDLGLLACQLGLALLRCAADRPPHPRSRRSAGDADHPPAARRTFRS